MHVRQELIELFSAFLRFESDGFHHWVSDRRLRRNMQRCLEVYSKHEPTFALESRSSEHFWVLYWHQCWHQEDVLAEGHLTAYLQEPCYWTAQQLARKFTSVQFGVSDFFQIGMAEIRTVLKGFKPDRGASLKTFANLAFSSLLKDQLRQRQEANLCSNLGLLRRVSKKRLLEALKQAGLASSAIAQYQLAWMCFNALYVPTQTGNNQLPAVDRSLWLAMTDLYNLERRKQLDGSVPTSNPETIERWLNQCATWVRAYLYPPVESLNIPKAGLESSSERQDDLTDPLQESLLTALVLQEERQERQEQWTQIFSAIVAALEQLNAESQAVLRLYYQQGLTQQQIMQQLQMSQATVSRRLTKAREALLLSLVQWNHQHLNKATTPNQIKEMSAALEEWLGVYYSESNPDSSSEAAGKETKR